MSSLQHPSQTSGCWIILTNTIRQHSWRSRPRLFVLLFGFWWGFVVVFDLLFNFILRQGLAESSRLASNLKFSYSSWSSWDYRNVPQHLALRQGLKCVVNAGLKCLGSSSPPPSASQVAASTGCHTRGLAKTMLLLCCSCRLWSCSTPKFQVVFSTFIPWECFTWTMMSFAKGSKFISSLPIYILFISLFFWPTLLMLHWMAVVGVDTLATIPELRRKSIHSSLSTMLTVGCFLKILYQIEEGPCVTLYYLFRFFFFLVMNFIKFFIASMDMVIFFFLLSLLKS